MAVKYIIQMYERYSIYEPAEGGYYYEGREPVKYYDKYDTKQEAMKALEQLIKNKNESLSEVDDGRGDTNEGYLVIGPSGIHAYSVNHKYIGDGFDYFVEPINRRGRHKEGWKPYC